MEDMIAPVLGLIAGFAVLLGLASRKSSTSDSSNPISEIKDLIDLGKLTPDTAMFLMKVKAEAARAGVLIRYVSGIRTREQQNALYAQGRTVPGAIVTHAKGCSSWHVQGRAADFAILSKDKSRAAYAIVGTIAKSLGGKWGGDFPGFPDLGHIEYHPGMTIEQVCKDPERDLAMRPFTVRPYNRFGEMSTKAPSGTDMVLYDELGSGKPTLKFPFWEADIIARMHSRWFPRRQYQVRLPDSLFVYIYVAGIRKGSVG